MMPNDSNAEEASSFTTNWDDLRFFLALGRRGTLAQTARDLNVRVSTVHRRLAALESAWGVTLFHRAPDGHTLTEIGSRVFENAVMVEEAVSALHAKLRVADRRQVVRLTATDDMIGFLATHVASFSAVRPDVQVRLSAQESILDLARGEADVAIRFVRPRDEDLLVARLCRIGFALYASHEYVTSHGVPKDDSDFAAHRFVVGDGALGETPVTKWLLQRIAPLQVWTVANTMSMVAAATRAGTGIAPLPYFVGDAEPDLVRVVAAPSESVVDAYLVYSKALSNSGAAKDFIRHIREAFANNEDVFAGRRR